MKKLILTLLYLTILTVTSSYAKTIPTDQKIAGLYVAFFNRAPDMSGLSYWTKKANDAQTNGQGASSVFKELSKGFAGHPVFKSTYGSLDNEDFVKAIYVNSLGREGDSEGINYWKGLLDNGMSRSDMVATFIEMSLTLDLTPQNFPNLSQSELDAAKLRQDLITNKTLVALAFVNKLQDKTNVADSQNPEDDPAYKASIKILSTINEDPSTVSEAIAYLNSITENSHPIEKMLDEWGVDVLKNTTVILSLSSHLNGFDLMDTLIPGKEATIRLSETPTGAIKVHLQTSKGSEEIIPAYISDNNITFIAPLDTIAGTLDVKSEDFSTFEISYKTMSDKDPFLETVEPDVATVGESVTITGQNLPAGNALVKFEDDNTSLTVTVTNNTIAFSVPDSAKSGAFHVEFSQLKTNSLYLTLKREIPLHVSLAEGVNIPAANISFTEGQTEYTLDTSYNTTMSVQKATIQYVHAMTVLPSGEYASLYSAVVLPDMTSLNVDANSTAIAWLFMGMGASATMSTASLERLYDKLLNDPKVQILADTIAKLQKEDFDAWVALSDANLKTVFQDALQEVITNYNTPVAHAKENGSGNEVVITQDPQNSNIYVDDNKYILELTNGKLNNGTVNVINDTRLFLSIEARDKKTGKIIGKYKHGDPFGKASILGPKGWPLFGISSLKNLQLDGTDAHIEIIAGATGGVTDKQKLATLLMARVWFEGVAAPALNIMLSTIINKKIDNRYGSNYSLARRIKTALSDIYGANFMVQFTEKIAGGNSSWSTLTKDFIYDPLKNGLKECYDHGVTSTKCEQTAKGIAELTGMGNTEHIVNKLMIMIASAGEKYILKTSVALVPVVGWITEASFIVYDNISTLSDTSVIAESLIDMGANPKEINAYVDFPFEVSSVSPLCVAQTAGKTTQTFNVGGKGLMSVDGTDPKVSIGIIPEEVEATSVSVPTTGTDLVADFSLDALLGNGSREDYLVVTNFGYSSVYSKPIRMVTADDSKIYFDTFTPDYATVGSTITLKGCGWIPLSEIEVTFANDKGEQESATIVSKNASEIQVVVPTDAVTGFMHVKTALKDASKYIHVNTFGLTDTVQDSVEEGKSLAVNGVGLATVAHLYFVDHNNNTVEGAMANVIDTGIWIDSVPAGLAVGPIRIYAVLGNGTKSNELTVAKLPKSPIATPQSSWFEKSITVTLAQENNADIYYKLGETNSSEKLYTGALTFNTADMINLDVNLYIFARVKVNGINYDSQMNDYTYSTCNEGETVAYHDDGSGYCAAEDTNSSYGKLYTFDDWKLECPEGMTLEVEKNFTDSYYCRSGSDRYMLKDIWFYSDKTIEEYDYLVLPEFTSLQNYKESNWLLHDMITEENGQKEYEGFNIVAKNAQGKWGRYNQKSISWYKGTEIPNSETLFDLKQNSDGTLMYVATSIKEWFQNGNKSLETLGDSRQNNDGSWSNTIAQEIKYYDTGIMKSLKTYVIKQNDNNYGNWVSLNSHIINWGDDGLKFYEAFYGQFQNSDGSWNEFTKPYKTIEWYPHTTNKHYEKLYESKKENDGTYSEYITVERNYDQNGKLSVEKLYEVKESNGHWESLLSSGKSWSDGKLTNIALYDIKQSNGLWYSLLASIKSYYSNGVLQEEEHLTSVETDSGYWEHIATSRIKHYTNGVKELEMSATVIINGQSWHISSKIIKEWYDNANIKEIDTYENGQWKSERWNYDGKKLN